MEQNGSADPGSKVRTPRTGTSTLEFTLVVAAAKLGAAIPPGSPSSHPLAQRHFADHLSCEQAASIATPPPGTYSAFQNLDAE